MARASKKRNEKVAADAELTLAKLEATRRWREQNADKMRQAELAWRAVNSDRLREKNQRRRARLMSAFIEDVDPQVVWDRDEGRCGICEQQIDPNVPWPERMSKTLDHIIPLSKGGVHSYANIQLAHHVCNSRKNNF